MKRSLPAILCAALLATQALAPGHALAQDEEQASPAPQPDAVTHDWSLDFEHSKPTTISVEDADGKVKWYWYMTYKVTNFSDDEIFFDPRFTVQSDNGKILTPNLGVDTAVFDAVRKLLRNPLLLSPVEVQGKIFKGEDYARESVAIWPVSEDDIDEFKLFVGGIFGETKIAMDPTTGQPIMIPVIDALTGEQKKDKDGNPMTQPLLLRRTKLLHYETPGTVETRQDPSIKLKTDKDVMR